MTQVTIRGKEKLLKQFNSQKNPFWRILSKDKTVVFAQTTESKMKESYDDLVGILENIDENNVYYLQIFPITDKKFTHPFASISFMLNEDDNAVGNAKGDDAPKFDKLGMSREMELIKEVALLKQEKAILEIRLKEQEDKNKLLVAEIKELEDELDECYDDDEEDGEEAGQVGNPLILAAAKLINEHGGLLVENLMNKKVSGDGPPKEEQEIKLSGVDTQPVEPPVTILDIIKELGQKDPQIHQHLYKLLLIARKKPLTFKYILTQLEKQ